jgi:anoctamin-7
MISYIERTKRFKAQKQETLKEFWWGILLIFCHLELIEWLLPTAVTFLEYWKRKSVSLAHHWDCMGFQDEEERPRPEFAARAPFLERNPVTGIREPSFPSSLRNKRVAAGIGIIFLMVRPSSCSCLLLSRVMDTTGAECSLSVQMSLVIIFIVAVIIYRVLVSIPLFQNSTFRSQAQAIANMTGAVVNLIIIMAMSRVYEKLAHRLTAWGESLP